ncbi:redoxin domain-containing protein [Nonomuraea rubra]|uniref:redoxin domain-containing protein n=1 Tax=Nonomuraea rubra TaxID=46180 RepID=UPI00360C929E
MFRDSAAAFAEAGVALRGVSTQRPDEQRAFAEAEDLPFPLLSDVDLTLCAALRLPTFRAGQDLRLKRAIVIADAGRTIHHVLHPVTDLPAAVEEALRLGAGVARERQAGAGARIRR